MCEEHFGALRDIKAVHRKNNNVPVLLSSLGAGGRAATVGGQNVFPVVSRSFCVKVDQMTRDSSHTFTLLCHAICKYNTVCAPG